MFTRQQAFKMGCFYWLRVKNSNYLHAEFSLGNWEAQSFILKAKLHLLA